MSVLRVPLLVKLHAPLSDHHGDVYKIDVGFQKPGSCGKVFHAAPGGRKLCRFLFTLMYFVPAEMEWERIAQCGGWACIYGGV